MLVFACIYGRVFVKNRFSDDARQALLMELPFTFSPLVGPIYVDTVVLDISGDQWLFNSQNQAEVNWTRSLGDEIARRAAESSLKVSVSVAANPDVAIHAARTFKGVTVVAPGAELSQLGNLSIKLLDYSLAGIDEKKAEEIAETLALWGIRTFIDFAKLPLAGVAQRLGQEGVRLQKLAQGKSERQLILVQPPVGFEQSLELEHPIAELEPLSFILSRLLNQLCANLNAQALATNELRLRLRRSEEHTSELQSQSNLVCRLLLEKKTTWSTACATPSAPAQPGSRSRTPPTSAPPAPSSPTSPPRRPSTRRSRPAGGRRSPTSYES